MLKESVKTENPIAYKMIAQAFLTNKLSHAFLFSSLPNYKINKEWKLLAQFLLTNDLNTDLVRDLEAYPDVVIVDGSKGLIKKESITSALKQMNQTSLEKKSPKILVILNLENANKQSLNSLLKFIEEPPQKTFIILTTNYWAKILPTIKSRCQIIKLKLPRYEDLTFTLANKYPQTYKLLAAIAINIEQVENINLQIIKYEKELAKFLQLALVNKHTFFPNFSQLITKDNYLVLCQILQVFFNDIWKIKHQQKIIWKKELASQYQAKNFNFHKALKAINQFLLDQNYYVNFDLSKSKMLIELGASYE